MQCHPPNKLLPKLKDLKSFSIPYAVRDNTTSCAVYDLRASVSLMLHSICKKLKVGEFKPTTISFQIVNCFVKYSIGFLEDVSFHIGKLFIPYNFMGMEIEEDA